MSIDKRPNGQWRVRWREYPNGPQKTQQFVRKVDAERHEAEVRVAPARGTYLTGDQQRVTLGQYVETYIARQVWKATHVRSGARLAEPSRDALPIAAPDRRHPPRRRRGIRGRTMGHVRARNGADHFQHLRGVMRSAMADGVIVVDSTTRIKLPAAGGDLVVLEPAVVRTLVGAAAPPFREAIVLGAHVGLRAGEAQGLLVSDVDFLRRTVNVRPQLDGHRRWSL